MSINIKKRKLSGENNTRSINNQQCISHGSYTNAELDTNTQSASDSISVLRPSTLTTLSSLVYFSPSTPLNHDIDTIHAANSSGFQTSTCENHEQKIENYRKNINEIKVNIQELDHKMEQLTIDKRRQEREILRLRYIEKYAWVFTDESCPVCFEQYKPNVIYDKCKHTVCMDCNKSLLENSRLPPLCPLCRNEITGYMKFNETKLRGEHISRVLNSNLFNSVFRTSDEIDLINNYNIFEMW